MEEIIEQLRELHESVSTPLHLPTDDELVLIEEQILISLPYDFRLFLLEVSDVVFGRVEPATAADPRSHTFLPEMASQAWDMGLPRHCIPICEYDGGYACIGMDGKVEFWSAVSGMSGQYWENIWYWCQDVWIADAG
ncbi:MAG: hypothetical protein ACI9Y1_001122 [Lentisphaeria bacterium]|jgi:hypothetical protein